MWLLKKLHSGYIRPDKGAAGDGRKRSGLRSDNSGFTLLELLIAVLILAVAIIPMLNSFVVNARVTRKAKIKLRSTMIAQDIMEGLKGYTTEDVYRQIAGLDDLRLVDNSSITDSATHKIVSANVVLISNNGLEATYGIKNMKYQGFDYDAKISLNGSDYTVSGNRWNKTGSEDIQIKPNSDPLAVIHDMNSNYDGLFMSDSYDVRRELFLKELREGEPPKFKADTVRRTFTITLSNNGVTAVGGQKQLANVEVKYESVSSGSVTGSFIKNYTAYNNVDIADDGCTIRNLYFFYYPAYTGKYDVDGLGEKVDIKYEDNIVFTNYDGIPVSFYIIKQIPPDSESEILAYLYTNEMVYEPKIYIKEPASVSVHARKTEVFSNLTKNLQDGSELTNKAKFYFGIGELAVTPAQLGADSMVSTKEVNRFFDAIVSVYEKGAADEGFPEEKILTKLDSTKIND